VGDPGRIATSNHWWMIVDINSRMLAMLLGLPMIASTDSLRPHRAIGEQGKHLIGHQVRGKWREPDFEARVGGQTGGELEAFRVATGNSHRGAMQVVADDPHLPPDDVWVERLAGAYAGMQEASVIADALASLARSCHY
jgi:hypothetical protein